MYILHVDSSMDSLFKNCSNVLTLQTFKGYLDTVNYQDIFRVTIVIVKFSLSPNPTLFFMCNVGIYSGHNTIYVVSLVVIFIWWFGESRKDRKLTVHHYRSIYTANVGFSLKSANLKSYQ